MFDELRRLPHPTIVALIAMASAVFFVGTAFAPNLISDYGVVPSRLTSAWNDLVGGGGSVNSAAVLLTLLLCVLIWAAVLLPRI